jgi:hypothetical protein
MRSPFALLCLSITVAAACSDPTQVDPACATQAECAAGRTCIDGRCRTSSNTDAATDIVAPSSDAARDAASAMDARPARRLASVVITPAMPVLETRRGTRVAQAFTATARFDDGTESPAAAPEWTLSDRTLGEIGTATGQFEASGFVGGQTVVTVRVPDGMGSTIAATTTLRVRLTAETFAAGVGREAIALFADVEAAAAGRSANVVYPLDRAVMPQNVYPANIQWLEGAAGDTFRVTLSKPNFTATSYVRHTGAGFTNSYLPELSAWQAFAQSDPSEPGEITVTRYIAASSRAFASAPVRVQFAPGALTGSVYYWTVSSARIVRIDDGTATRVNFMPNPPWPRNRDSNCIGCHSVSPSGRYMAGRLGGGFNTGTVFDLTTDLSGAAPPTRFNPTQTDWWFAAWSPDERRLVATRGPSPTGLGLLDPATGAPVAAMGAGLPANNATHPSWSPDGTAIAYVSGASDWGVDYRNGDLSIVPVTAADTFAAPRTVQRGATLTGRNPAHSAISYPVWTPDSKWIVFAHGASARSSTEPAALFITDREGTQSLRLDNANGGPDQALSFEPRLSPFDTGGYFWLAFLSRRDYGNSLAGTRGSNREQIWVTAIQRAPTEPDGTPGTRWTSDPSRVGYWLPGQDPASRNISAFWAPRPCRPNGERCSVASECCSNDCRPPAGGGEAVCSPPPRTECRQEGQTCSVDADCCDGLTCFNRACLRRPG